MIRPNSGQAAHETPLGGTRVVEITSGVAGSMAGMILADYGAEVVVVEPPGGAPLRGRPGWEMWSRGKQSVVLDLEVDGSLEPVERLIASADVVIRDPDPGDLGSRIDAMCARDPRLIECRISGFGTPEFDAVLPADEGIIAARSGRLQGLDELSGSAAAWAAERPVFLASPIGTFATAMLTVQGALGALLQRDNDGRGRQVRTSMLDGLAAATMRIAYRREGDHVVPAREDALDGLVRLGITLTFMTAECADGRYIQMCARTDAHFRNWLRATGLEQIGQEPRYAGAPMGFQSEADLVELRDHLRSAMRTKTQEEWMELFIHEYDVGADPVLGFEEFLAHPQMVENGYVVDILDAFKGPVRELGRIAQLPEMADVPLGPPPQLGANQALLDASRPAHSPAPAFAYAAGAPRPLPFEGVTIVELATFLAGPFGATLLAEAGARVIKVEPPTGDQFRRVGLEFAHLAHGKESIALDLKSEDGRSILHRLVEQADVVLHNMRPGIVERLGASYETLREVNPKLIYVNAASYGSRGPQSDRPAFHSTPHALSGGAVLQAGEGNAPVDDSYPDPCAGLALSAAVALGLVSRSRDGRGRYIETSMLCSTGYVHSNELVEFEGRTATAMVDSEQRGLHALYRLYRCGPGWIFLAAESRDQWIALTEALGHPEWATNYSWHLSGEPLSHDAQLTLALDQVFALKPAEEWEHLLMRQGVSCVRADGPSFEGFLLSQGFVEPMHHAEFGDYFRLRPRIDFAGSRSRRGAACSVGEHSSDILSELQYSVGQQRTFVQAGVVA